MNRTTVTLTRTARVPDPLRLARCKRAPELGPKLLFFSGGTALRSLSERLTAYTHNAIHLVTPFDSGGSSAKLRRAFRMLAVGDLRNRLMALADRSVQGHPAVVALFAHRLPKDAAPADLHARLAALASGRAPEMRAIEEPMRALIQSHLGFFRERMPARFDLRGASIGNLILAGGYLNQNRHIDPVVFLFSRLVEARGVVRPTTSRHLHLGAELADGRVVAGQHRLTAKEEPDLGARIERMFLTPGLRTPRPVEAPLPASIDRLVRGAELICYPPGSFYSSVLAHFLLRGAGDAIAETGVPKVYVPNTTRDPEQRDIPLPLAVERLIEAVRASAHRPRRTNELLHDVLVDADGAGIGTDQLKAVERLGARVIDLPLITETSAPYIDSVRLAEALVSLAG